MYKFYRPPIGSSVQCHSTLFCIEDCGYCIVRCGHSPKWLCRPDCSYVSAELLKSNSPVKATHVSPPSRPNDRCEIFDFSPSPSSQIYFPYLARDLAYQHHTRRNRTDNNDSLYAFCISMKHSFKGRTILFCLLHDSSSCKTTAVKNQTSIYVNAAMFPWNLFWVYRVPVFVYYYCTFAWEPLVVEGARGKITQSAKIIWRFQDLKVDADARLFYYFYL